jgi:hypothetical protein
MFTRFLARLELRRTTATLLARGDDRLLDDIGLTRADVQAMHLGLTQIEAQAQVSKFHSLPARRNLAA